MEEGYNPNETSILLEKPTEVDETESSSSITNTTNENNETDENSSNGGKASLPQTVLNMLKIYFGTGVLALPFATNEAGLLWHPLGLLLITIWSIYSTDCLLQAHNYMTQYYAAVEAEERIQELLHQEIILNEKSSLDSANVDDDRRDRNKRKTDTFGKLAYFAFGDIGFQTIDFFMLILMVGIIICYEDAILGFIESTRFTTGNRNIDAFGMLLALIPIVSLSDFSIIAKISALGTSLIIFVFLLIGIYGIKENGMEGFKEIPEENYWPDGFSGFSSWYGVVAFSYGAIPFTFNLKESMKDSNQIMYATKWSLWLVLFAYIMIGELILIIFWPSLHGIRSDVTRVLPQDTIISYFVSLSMAMVVLFSSPMIVVPCGDLVKKKLGLDGEKNSPSPANTTGAIIRISMCIICALISLLVPDFVFMISFFGCLCGSMLAYAYPPLAHMRCYIKLIQISPDMERKRGRIILDTFVFFIGLMSTILTTCITFQTMMEKIRSNQEKS